MTSVPNHDRSLEMMRANLVQLLSSQELVNMVMDLTDALYSMDKTYPDIQWSHTLQSNPGGDLVFRINMTRRINNK